MVDAELAQDFLGHAWIERNFFRIVLNTADLFDLRRIGAERHPAVNIFGLLHANQIDQPENRPDEKSKSSKSLFGTRRETRVNERDRNFPRMGEGNEIGPNLRLDQNNPRWIND